MKYRFYFCLPSARPAAFAFVTPGIYHDKDKHHKPKHQQHERSGFVFPKLLNALGYFGEVHAETNLHPNSAKRKCEREPRRRFPDQNQLSPGSEVRGAEGDELVNAQQSEGNEPVEFPIEC